MIAGNGGERRETCPELEAVVNEVIEFVLSGATNDYRKCHRRCRGDKCIGSGVMDVCGGRSPSDIGFPNRVTVVLTMDELGFCRYRPGNEETSGV